MSYLHQPLIKEQIEAFFCAEIFIQNAKFVTVVESAYFYFNQVQVFSW